MDDDLALLAVDPLTSPTAAKALRFRGVGNGTLLALLVLVFVGFGATRGWPDEGSQMGTFARFVFSFALLGFAGAFANWLACILLFVNVFGIPGSGVIPNRATTIRRKLKDILMSTFFDRESMKRYSKSQLDSFFAGFDPEHSTRVWAESSSADGVLFDAICATGIENQEEARKMIEPMKSILIGLASDLGTELITHLDLENIGTVHNEDLQELVDEYLTDRLQEFDGNKATSFIQMLVGHHLEWLIVWGGLFGSIAGLLAEMLRLMPSYN